MARIVLGKKQSLDNAHAVTVWDSIEDYVSRAEIEELVERTAAEVRERTRGKRVGFGWSGGKDSLALEVVMRRAGISNCVLAITNLEFPEHLRYVTAHMPDGLTVVNTGQDLEWLSRHREMIFPLTSAQAAKWFKIIQWAAQTKFVKDERLDIMIVGRRKIEGNHVDDGDGSKMYRNRQAVTRYSPIADWKHEHVFAAMHYFELDEPPYFRWPNGIVQGTLSWPARQFLGRAYDLRRGGMRPSRHRGWVETYVIDPGIVRDAARKIPEAAAFLDSLAGARP